MNLRPVLFGTALLALAAAGCNREAGHSAADNQEAAEAGMPTGDSTVTSLVKRGVVADRVKTKKVKDRSTDYRFYPDEDFSTALRLTKAGPNEGKGFAEEKEIDLTPYADKYIEVQGTSFAKRWVYNAVILGVARSAQDTMVHLNPPAESQPVQGEMTGQPSNP